MIVRVDGETWCGGVVDLREADVDGSELVAAIRGARSEYGVFCPSPGAVHERAGYVHHGMSLRTRTAIADAARSRGLSAPQDDELVAIREQLAAIETQDGPNVRPAAAASGDVDRLRERIASLRGTVQTLEECGRDASDERERLREVAGRLSELTTRRIGAVQARTQARTQRDRRDRRLRLEDRAANLERAARAHLVERLRPAYCRAVEVIDPSTADPMAEDSVTAALATLKIASVTAPVVLAVDRFSSPHAAAEWLAAPVVRL